MTPVNTPTDPPVPVAAFGFRTTDDGYTFNGGNGVTIPPDNLVRAAQSRISLTGQNPGEFELGSFPGTNDNQRERFLFDLAMGRDWSPYFEVEYYHVTPDGFGFPGLFLSSLNVGDPTSIIISGNSVTAGDSGAFATITPGNWYTIGMQLLPDTSLRYYVVGNGVDEELILPNTGLNRLADAEIAGISVGALTSVADQSLAVHVAGLTYGSNYQVPLTVEPEVPGDQFAFINSVTDGEVIELNDGDVLEITPGSIINKSVTIRASEASKSNGNPPVIRPNAGSFSFPLFDIQTSGTLTLENVIVDGNNPTVAGGSNVPFLVSIASENAGFSANGVGFQNANTGLIRTAGAFWTDGNNAVSIEGSTLDNSGVGIITQANAPRPTSGASLSVNRSEFGSNITFPVRFQGADTVSLTRNIIRPSIKMQFTGGPGINDLTIGGPGNGNLYFGRSGTVIGSTQTNSLTFSHNWHADYFGVGEFEQDGFLVGNAPPLSTALASQLALVNGERVYSANLVETNIIAQFDRDNDGLPDAWEIGDPDANYLSIDTNNNGVPDGVHVLLGVPLDFNDPAVLAVVWPDGSLAADTSGSGYADWYENVREGLTGLPANLGDLTDSGDVSLGDAVRALQIINGAIPIGIVEDPNRINVTGGAALSLANPLQILRFQAGVRTTFPAVPGIN